MLSETIFLLRNLEESSREIEQIYSKAFCRDSEACSEISEGLTCAPQKCKTERNTIIYEEIRAASTLLECRNGLLVLYRFKKKLRKLSVILPCKSDKIALYSFAVP